MGGGAENGERKFPEPHDSDAANHVWNGESDSFYHSVIRCLAAEGFSESDIAKITGGNFLRVFKAATAKK